MAVYRFRVTYEDHEDVFRDIEIKTMQTFEDFHRAIQEAIGFDNSKPAIWYVSDDYWRKEDEIGVVNDADTKEKKANRSKIADFIEGPHQKFLYIFDPEKEWTFCVELMKIILEEPKYVLPKCVKIVGAPPKQYKATNIPPPPEEDDDEGKSNGTEKEKEKIFTSEEGYDEDVKEDEDTPLIEGDEDLSEGEPGDEEPPVEDVEE